MKHSNQQKQRSEGSPIAEQTDTELLEFHGFVTEQKKYSIRIKSGNTDYLIKLPNGVPIAREVYRPTIDISGSKLTTVYPCTAANGNQRDNVQLEFDLPSMLYIKGFSHPTILTHFVGANFP